MLALTSCEAAGGREAVVPDIPFAADAKISYDGLDVSAHITRNGAGEWEFRVTEPYALEGVVMTVEDGKTAVSFGGMESRSDEADGTVSMAKAIADVYDAAAGTQVNASGEGYTLSGTTELGSYTINLDGAGVPELFFADIGGLRVEINGLERIQPPEREAQIIE